MVTTEAGTATTGTLPEAVVERFARRWAQALVGDESTPDDPPAVAAELRPLVTRLARVVGTDRSDEALARDIADVVLSRGQATAAVVGPTLLVLLDGLIDDFGDVPGWCGVEVARVRGFAVAARVAEALTEAVRGRTLDAQEQMHRAALTAVRTAERDRRRSETRFRALFNQVAAGIGIISTSGLVVDGNDTWVRQMGHPLEEMRGRSITDLVTAGSDPLALTRILELLRGDRESFRLEFTHVRHDGRPYVLDLSVSRVRAGHGEPDFVVGIAVDVTERKRLEDRLWHESRHDPLTGLPNRMMFFECLAATLDAPDRSSPVGVCYVDLDGFKIINDGLGHDVGDRLLVRVELHDPRADANHVSRHALATEVAAALTRGEFYLVYQPLVGLADGTVRSAEALLRWRHPQLGLVPPDRFITMAEETGHIDVLGRWALTTACRAAQQ